MHKVAMVEEKRTSETAYFAPARSSTLPTSTSDYPSLTSLVVNRLLLQPFGLPFISTFIPCSLLLQG
jgi:hypothetical protein